MKLLTTFLLVTLLSCATNPSHEAHKQMTEQTALNNQTMKDHDFLSCMYDDSYFPTFLVDMCKQILLDLCGEIERTKPSSLDALYALTHHSTEQLNDLENEFFENNSEIETGARECLGMDFEFIATTYGFDADVEELIAPRNW